MTQIRAKCRRTLSVLMLFVLAACESLSAIAFQKAENSGLEAPQHVKLFYLSNSDGQDVFSILDRGAVYNDLQYAVSTCRSTALVGEAAIPIAVAGGQFFFGQLVDALAARVEALRESGQRSYAGSVVTDSKAFHDLPECLLLLRYGTEIQLPNSVQGIGDVGLAALFVKLDQGGAQNWLLSYLIVHNSLAVTASGEPAEIDLAFAVAGKIVSYDKTGKKIVRSLPEDSMSIRAVPLGGETAVVNCYSVPQRNCVYETDIFVVADAADRAEGGASFSVGVAETGSVAKSFDAAAAELEALKAAFGPAIGKAIENRLTPDE